MQLCLCGFHDLLILIRRLRSIRIACHTHGG
jgi:hypothetical protein